MNNEIVRRRVSRIDARIQLLSEAISSYEDFAYAAMRLTLLLMRKIDLSYFQVHKMTGRLQALDSEITQSFVDAHSTLTFRSPEYARQKVEIFRRHYLDRLIENREV
jgi:hypothetical protein